MEDTWSQISTIPRAVDAAASAYHPAWGIIMAGGFDSDSDVTITKDAEVFESLAPIPYSSSYHCVAAIDADHIFTTGLNGNDDTYIYYRDTGEWVSLPKMPTARNGMGCGVVRDDSGRPEVVVVGGLGGGGSGYLDVVEIYRVDDQSWRTGISSNFNISSETIDAISFLQPKNPSRLQLISQLWHSMETHFISLVGMMAPTPPPYTSLKALMRAGH